MQHVKCVLGFRLGNKVDSDGVLYIFTFLLVFCSDLLSGQYITQNLTNSNKQNIGIKTKTAKNSYS